MQHRGDQKQGFTRLIVGKFRKAGKDLVGAAAGRPVDNPMKGDATTFRLHPGPHRIELQVNGRVRAAAAFDLLP